MLCNSLQDPVNKRHHNKKEMFTSYLDRAIMLKVNLKAGGHDAGPT